VNGPPFPPLGAEVAVPVQVFVKHEMLCVVTFVTIGNVGCVMVMTEFVTQEFGVDTSCTETVYNPAHKEPTLLVFEMTLPVKVDHV
jgi:hypothetical protein